ncbi:MAG: glycerol dehydratase reactivase beta/small subunit family protein [Eubacteriales bacterium]
MNEIYAGWTGEKPVIVLMCPDDGFFEAQKREIMLGIEEEGVPVAVKTGEGEADDLGFEAARMSPLEVGIGLDKQGKAVLQHRKLSRRRPLFTVDLNLRPEAARSIGINAARLVKALPLKKI